MKKVYIDWGNDSSETDSEDEPDSSYGEGSEDEDNNENDSICKWVLYACSEREILTLVICVWQGLTLHQIILGLIILTK